MPIVLFIFHLQTISFFTFKEDQYLLLAKLHFHFASYVYFGLSLLVAQMLGSALLCIPHTTMKQY